MMDRIRKFLQSSGGTTAVVVGIIICIGAAVWSIWNNFKQDSAVAAANSVMFVDIENGKAFPVELTPSMTYPVKSPFTGHTTGYRAEMCGWTKDGHVRKEPFYVVLNQELGKSGPTFCPDCGRLVVPHNPKAVEGRRPPPTQQEYLAMSHSYP